MNRLRDLFRRAGNFLRLRRAPRPAWPAPSGRRIAYLMNRFPNLTETFVYREVETLRRQGADIVTISIRRPPRTELSEESHVHVDQTWYVLPVGLGELLLSHTRAFLGRPRVYLRSLAEVLRGSHTAEKDRLRSLCHFAEAVTLIEPLRAAGVEHLHGHFAVGSTTLAWVLSRFLDLPFSFTAHAYDIWRDRLLLPQKLNRASFVVTCTEYNRQHLEETYRPRAPIRVVHHGVDVERFRPVVREPSGSPRLLAVGRLCEQKGFPTLLEACARLASDGHAFKCRIVGDGPLATELHQLAERLGVGDRVRFTGRVFQEDMLKQYAWADLFVLPCTLASDEDRDGIPNVFLEAMACGLPVVSTRFSGIPELVEEGRTGILVPPDDPAALAAALVPLLDDPVRRQHLGAAGRERVERHFSLQASASRLAQLHSRAGAPIVGPRTWEVELA